MNVRFAWLALAFGCVVLGCSALGCASNGPTIIVDVITDFAPGAEFQAVRIRVIDGPELVTSALGSESDQYLRARRVATFDSDLSPGDVTVRVELLRPDGSVLASRSRSGTLTNILAVTAVFTRNCQGVRCGAGEVCIDEVCTDETCDPTNPASCPDAVLCQGDTDCVRPDLADCARASCIQFLCLVETDDSCGAGLYCNPDAGCEPLSSSADGGIDASTDCGAACGGDGLCREGIIDCAAGSPVCVESNTGLGSPCAVEGASGTCDGLGECVVGCVDGSPCLRDNPCEAGITRCIGVVAMCEADGAAALDTPCRAAAGSCDAAEVCDGSSTECPSDAVLSGDICRASEGPCDLEETCDGTLPSCPSDDFATVGSACTDGFCDGLVAECQSGCTPGAPCDTGNVCETGSLDCSGATPTCTSSGNRPNGMMCDTTLFSGWSTCGGFTGTCGNAGQRTRTATYRECQSGSCSARDANESEACTRNTNGTMCGATSCGGYGACGGFTDRCDLGGTQSRTCTDRACAGGGCGSSNRSENRNCNRTLSETCGDLIDTDCDGTCDEGCRFPIHRGVRGADHFYTASQSELLGAGYTYEGVAFYIYPGSHAGLVPLFRCRNGTDHFVSTSSTCEGRTVEGTLGYVRRPNQPSCGSVILYRLFYAAGPDHFFTTSAAERSSAIPPYVAEGNAAQVWRTP